MTFQAEEINHEEYCYWCNELMTPHLIAPTGEIRYTCPTQAFCSSLDVGLAAYDKDQAELAERGWAAHLGEQP
jgi:hypothetical protein